MNMQDDLDPTQSGSINISSEVKFESEEKASPAEDLAPSSQPSEELDDEALFATAEEPINRVKRGDEINITAKDPTIRNIDIGVGWDLKAFDTNPLDLDTSVFLLDKNDQTRVDEDFIFYNCMMGAEGAVKHHGDNRTGAGNGDDEKVSIELNTLPYDVTKIVFVLSIYDVDYQEHNFSMVKNVFFRITNQETHHEIFRYELDEELSAGHEGLIIGHLERIGMEWVFRAIGETVEGGLQTIAKNYGIVIAEDAQA
ncbi:MAG: TerD family protein [Alphaproteobacteria bacterium]|nr:TerD family protein [Alphaproteobacteria bacterium]